MMADQFVVAPKVRPGDRVRLVSPASYPDRASVDDCLAILESWGLRAEVAPHALDRWGYMAGSDADRLEDLNGAFRDPEVRAIVATRGGAGAYRIADRIVLQRVPGAVSAAAEVPGSARGRLIGGNLAALATSVGVRMPSMSGAVLFLEDQRVVGLGTIDRQITQLITSGALDGIVGIALGSFEGFRDYSDRGWTLSDVLADRLGHLGVPVLGGIFAGHDLSGPNGSPDQTALPLGSFATLDTWDGSLTIDPVVCSVATGQ